MSADMSVRDAYQLKDQHGFSGFPVTQNGAMGAKLVGLVTGRDFDFLSSDEYDTAVSEVLRLQPLRLHSRVTCVMCTVSMDVVCPVVRCALHSTTYMYVI